MIFLTLNIGKLYHSLGAQRTINFIVSLEHLLFYKNIWEMDYVHLPRQIITYIPNLYSKLNGRVEKHKWKTDIFNFLKGVYKGIPTMEFYS